jgi:hypothetical protein
MPYGNSTPGGGIETRQIACISGMFTRFILVAALALTASPGGSPWDKLPATWNLADVYRVLQESPWSPAATKLDTQFTSRHSDTLTGLVTDAPVNPNNQSQVSGFEISRAKSQASVPVLWWSSKTIRLAQQRLCQLRRESSTKKGGSSFISLGKSTAARL